jgi:hypothetical protein
MSRSTIHDFILDGYPGSLLSRPARRRWQMSVRGLLVGTFVLTCCMWVLTILSRAVGGAREAARRSQCEGHLCQLQMALLNYHDTYGAFPPAYIADANGRPMHSWRVLILPFIGQKSLFDLYDFREPWDGPHNSALLKRMPAIFSCPTRSSDPRELTTFVAITGPGTMFPGAGSVNLDDVTDGTGVTILFAEVANVDIPWTAPVDLDARTMSLRVNDPRRAGISSKHPHGAHVCLVDGRRFLPETVCSDALRTLITIAGHDGIGYDDGQQAF